MDSEFIQEFSHHNDQNATNFIHTAFPHLTNKTRNVDRKCIDNKITSVDVMPAQAPAASLPNTESSPSFLRNIF
jgi:hypothetical protein